MPVSNFVLVMVVLVATPTGVKLMPVDISNEDLNTFYYLMKYGYVGEGSDAEKSAGSEMLTSGLIADGIRRFQVSTFYPMHIWKGHLHSSTIKVIASSSLIYT